MTWTYQSSGIANSDMLKVRLIIGDTNDRQQLLQDEEINFALANDSSPTMAAAVCCDFLSARYAFLCNTDNGELRISAAARHKHYRDLADRLRKGGPGDVPGNENVIAATMYVGGQSKAAVDTLNDNSDNAAETFRIGQDDHPDDVAAMDTTDDT